MIKRFETLGAEQLYDLGFQDLLNRPSGYVFRTATFVYTRYVFSFLGRDLFLMMMHSSCLVFSQFVIAKMIYTCFHSQKHKFWSNRHFWLFVIVNIEW